MGEPSRPDPERLLARLRENEAAARRGRLKVFLGAFPGAGKTFAMLENAQAARAAGRDVVVGVVETHGRLDTERLVAGLDVIPRRATLHRGVRLEEFDLDAALLRAPDLLLVDELAHTNAPGSRHARRWQDVRELLDRGINVHTTLNIQHIESLNDTVAQITGVVVHETVPDAILDDADELELVDVSPEVLEERLKAGKVYLPEHAARALERFFRRGNLIALRELALRRTAQQVDAAMREWHEEAGGPQAAAAERVLVAVPAGTGAKRLVRAGWRLAQALRAECLVLHVETPEIRHAREPVREAATDALFLAEQLGARAVMLTADRPADELLAHARREGVTRIVVGRTIGRRRVPWRPSMADRLAEGGEGISLEIVPLRLEAIRHRRRPGQAAAASGAIEYLRATGWVLLAALAGLPVRESVSTTDIAMIFLLAVAIAGARAALGPALVAAATSIAVFDLVFVPPYYTYAVSDTRYVLTFAVMLGVAVAMARLTSRIRGQAVAARQREQRTATLLELAHELARSHDGPAAIAAVRRRIRDLLALDAIVRAATEAGELEPASIGAQGDDPRDETAARWALERRQLAGAGTATLPAATRLWIPLVVGAQAVGVLGVLPQGTMAPDQRHLLETIAGQLAVALDRFRLTERTARDKVAIEAERLRTALLSSLSHDLRTPLSAVEGAADTILGRPDLPLATRTELLQGIISESRRMGHLIGNLLEMVRLESGALEVQAEWQSVEELVGMARLRVEKQLEDHHVTVDVPAALPLLVVDGVLIEQLLVNLLENAARHTPPGSAIRVAAAIRDRQLELTVDDDGPGVPEEEREKIFEPLHRGATAAVSGSGLGLSIARGIVLAHGGTIAGEAAPLGGLRIRVRLPLPAEQPVIEGESGSG